MKLLLDENTSYRILKLIEGHYPGSAHVNSAGVPLRSDRAIWKHARAQDFVIITFDSDFVQLAALHGAPPHIVLLELRNPDYKAVAQVLIERRSMIEAFVADRSKEAAAVMAISA